MTCISFEVIKCTRFKVDRIFFFYSDSVTVNPSLQRLHWRGPFYLCKASHTHTRTLISIIHHLIILLLSMNSQRAHTHICRHTPLHGKHEHIKALSNGLHLYIGRHMLPINHVIQIKGHSYRYVQSRIHKVLTRTWDDDHQLGDMMVPNSYTRLAGPARETLTQSTMGKHFVEGCSQV